MDPIAAAPQTVLLDFFFPGFSVFSTAVQKYLHIDLNLYIPLVLLCGGLTFAWQYFSEYLWSKVEEYLMSVVDIRTDDEIYNMLMSWVASQRFAQGARRFVVNTNLSSRSWFLYRWDDEDDEDDDTVPDGEEDYSGRKKKKALAYTPTFGSHWFWYKNRLLIFRRTQNTSNSGWLTASEKEEISISCFGRNPWVLKELLHEARASYMRRDEAKTLIYRGTTRSGSTEPTWQRSMARTTRPFSTVILNEKVKKDLIDDVTDYLDPTTRRWYSNRGIPYRRGYLLHGPPGTGKSSLSLALAGFFKMRIYIVSLSSVAASEENLASLFAELPRRCVVLLEDIDSAGLTHTREDGSTTTVVAEGDSDMVPGQLTAGEGNSSNGPSKPGVTTVVPQPIGRLSLSGLLNILDGVASQEGRVLIMTTNHVEKLDKALIRPGRVDMIVKFDKADTEMTAAIFRAIFAPLEGDDAPVKRIDEKYADLAQALEAERKEAAEKARKKEEILAHVEVLAARFAERIPGHEFSPAEIQGFLLKHKRSPEAAVKGAEQWVLDARKEKKEKELKEAEEKRKKEEKEKKEKEEAEKKEKEEKEKKEKEEKEEAEKKKKEEEEKEKKEKKEKKKKSSKRKSKKSSRRKSKKEDSDSGSSDSSDSDSESEAEASGAESKKRSKSSEKKETTTTTTTKHEAKPAAVVVEPPASLGTESSNQTIVAETEGKDKVQADAAVEDGKQQGADSGYGTP
ncbi:BCS1 N terminal-domain-containing protein [Cercophora newfieldiana]|uniref:BCS1 N terminal-domain-containing protein n=1 Tax=Cercophora newfieldiana TaxID=92897 RepID=A0AA39XXL0_9PEZI|nr:BCS1 N terminal-domain-containing protein [Cercophora newfieldiana]